MRHFGIIKMGERGGPGVPFVLSKVVASSVDQSRIDTSPSLQLYR